MRWWCCLVVVVVTLDVASGAEIHEATDALDLPRLQRILRASPPAVHSTDADGNTPLHVVARHIAATTLRGRDESAMLLSVLELLIARGADRSSKDRQGRTPVEIALARDAAGATNLHRASKAGHATTVRALLQLGAEVDSRAMDAARAGKHQAVEKLLVEQDVRQRQARLGEAFADAMRKQREIDETAERLAGVFAEAGRRMEEQRAAEARPTGLLAPEMRCVANIADASFEFRGKLDADRRRFLENDDDVVLLPFESPATAGTWYFFTPFGAYRHSIRFPESGDGDPFVLVLPQTPRVRVQPFWNSESLRDTPPWREVGLARRDCDSCPEIRAAEVPMAEGKAVLARRLAELVDEVWKREIAKEQGSLLDEVADADNRRSVKAFRRNLELCAAVGGAAGERSRAHIAEIDRALERMPELAVTPVPPQLAAAPRYENEMRCLAAIADVGTLGSVGVRLPDPDELKYDYEQVVAGERNEPALLYAAEDGRTPGTWFFFTPWMSYRAQFRYPDFDFPAFQQKAKELETRMEELAKQLKAAAEGEKVDFARVGQLFELYESVHTSPDDAVVAAKMSEAIEQRVTGAPRTKELLTALFALIREGEAFEAAAPWGKAGAPLARYEMDLPGVPRVQVIPVITKNPDPPFGDGVVWRNVALRKVKGHECRQACAPLAPAPADDAYARTVLTDRILRVLDSHWNYEILDTEKTSDGTIVRATELTPQRLGNFDWLGRGLRVCATVAGPVGQKARSYLAKAGQ